MPEQPYLQVQTTDTRPGDQFSATDAVSTCSIELGHRTRTLIDDAADLESTRHQAGHQSHTRSSEIGLGENFYTLKDSIRYPLTPSQHHHFTVRLPAASPGGIAHSDCFEVGRGVLARACFDEGLCDVSGCGKSLEPRTKEKLD